jgi:ribosomal protein S12 methylthiotransferase
MNERDNVCNYLDMPLQHISDSVLKSMRRGTTKAKTTKLIEDIRAKVPGIALRTTLIVGYPGETEEDFQELYDWVAETKFDRMGAFTYSHEDNTHAFKLEDDVPEEVKLERAEKLMELQSGISLEANEAKIGKTFKVLFDRIEGEYLIGRTEFDSPEVDNEVLVKKAEGYTRIGDYADVEITGAEYFDLYGKLV